MTTIHTLDLNYLGDKETIASYILVNDAGPVMIETGPGTTTEALTAGLASLGFAPSDVKHVLVTHIHFDHAGAAGWMARHGAHVYVHEFGYNHLVDPSRLIASAKRIYKDRMDYLWGDLLPIPEDRITALYDNDVLSLEGIEIRAIETPGHARHHHVYAIETADGRIAFTGDAAGTHVAGATYVSPPMPPPELDLEAWMKSIERLEAERFDRIYPTHFGAVDDPADHFTRLKPALVAHGEFVRAMMEQDLDRAEMQQRYTEWYVQAGRDGGIPDAKIGPYITDTFADMNLTGILRYWTKRAEQAPT